MIPTKVYNILYDLIPMIVLFSVVMAISRVMYMIICKEKIVIYKEIMTLFSIIYIFALFMLVTTTDFESFSNNFVPFREITRYRITSPLFYRNVIGNILLFIPFGYIVTNMLTDKTKKAHFFATLFEVAVTSVSIELIQMFIGRSFDVDDIFLNIIGGILGYLCFIFLHFIINKFPKWVNNELMKDLFCILAIIVVLSIIIIIFM